MNQIKLDFLLSFFEKKDIPNWKEIATNLILFGKCIIAGDSKLWYGGIGNFIELNEAESAFNCSKLTFDLDEFMGSQWYIECLESHKIELSLEILTLRDKIREIEKSMDLL